MTWEKKRVLITAKAAPETSTKHGEVVCTAGITDQGEFIRLYPIPLDLFRQGKGFRKFDWIEVECEKAKEYLSRKESYKIRGNTLRVVDRSLNEKVKGKTNWAGRNEVLMPMVNQSIEELEQAFKDDKTSLGLIKVNELTEFIRTKDLDEGDKVIHKVMQTVLDQSFGTENLRGFEPLQQIPHIYKYHFTCKGDACHKHRMTCEDWELFEAHRTWPDRYKEKTWDMIQDRFFRFMKERDLHFFLGTESQYGHWLIIGIYYPPKLD